MHTGRLSQVVEVGHGYSSAMNILKFSLYHENNDNIANITNAWMILSNQFYKI